MFIKSVRENFLSHYLKGWPNTLVHIGHFIIDGAIGREPFRTYETISPDSIAKTYLEFHNQDKSAWSWEIELRTSVEKF